MKKDKIENKKEAKIKELAERIYNTLDPWDKAETSVEETEKCLQDDPLAAVEYLLEIVENM